MSPSIACPRSALALRVLRGGLVLGVLAAFPAPAGASLGQWSSGGPDGGVISGIAVDPNAPGTVYSATYQPIANRGVLYKSTNGGSTWSPLSLVSSSIDFLGIGAGAPSSVYVVADGDCQLSGDINICFSVSPFRSTDGGNTWTAINDGLPSVISSFAIDPSNPAVLYAGGEYGDGTPFLFHSVNAGNSWVPMSTAWIPVDTAITTITVDNRSSATLYVGMSTYPGAAMFKSTDQGQTWISIAAGLAPVAPANVRQIDELVVDPFTPGRLYIETTDFNVQVQGDSETVTELDSESFASADGGVSWAGLPAQAGRLFLDPSKPGTLYSPAGQSINYSTDGGATWKAGPFAGLTNIGTLAIAPSPSGVLYAGTDGQGILENASLSGQWTAANQGLGATLPLALAVDPTSSTVYAGGQYGGVYKSTDAGATWTAMNEGIVFPFPTVTALAVDASHPSVVYATTYSGLFKSSDGGLTWFAMGSVLQSQLLLAIAVDPTSSSVVYIGTASSGVFKSTDGGVSWSPAGSNPGSGAVNAFGFSSTSPPELLAATGAGLYRSTDGAATWTTLSAAMSPPDPPIYAVGFDASHPATIFAASSVVLKSTDNGATWSSSPTSPSGGVFALTVAPTSPAIVFAGTYGGGVSRSVDGGASWTALNAGLLNQVVTALAGDAQGTFVHAATFGAGVFDLTLATPPPCAASSTNLCLQADRFSLRASFTTAEGQTGDAQVVPLSDDSGYLWFFDPSNVEVLAKVIDGCALNNRFWFFDAGLTNVATTVSVTDTQTGVLRSYLNPQGVAFAPNQDINAFDCSASSPLGDAAGARKASAPADNPPQAAREALHEDRGDGAEAGLCSPNGRILCLSSDRFKITATYNAGASGSGRAQTVSLTDDTGYLWFFDAANVEAVIKVLNGCGLNGHYWVFAGGLTNVNVVITVTDTQAGVSKTYTNPAGTTFLPLQDTGAFATCP